MGTSETEEAKDKNGVQNNFYPSLSADNETGLTQVESLCMNCEEQGTTKFLCILIPFYKEVILSSFSCSFCGFSNNEIQSAGSIQDKGSVLSLTVTKPEDLNRQVVKTDTASIKIPSLDFEIPPNSQKGTLSTVEGILQRSIAGLSQHQPVRRITEPEVAEKIDTFISKLNELLLVTTPFVLKIDDPSGNSFIENPIAPQADPNLIQTYYVRSLDQDAALGLQPTSASDSRPNEVSGEVDLSNEVLTFDTHCPNCKSPCQTNMKMVKIPYFKEVIIMATNCDNCGEKTNEVKSGTGFEPMGKKLTLSVETAEDLSRDVLKSETCSVLIPELQIESGGFAHSGKFTTVEGLVLDMKKVLIDSNPFVGGDSDKSTKMLNLGTELTNLAQGKKSFTLILDDPNSNSYIQNLYLPDVDPRLKSEEYERTFEQNEMLGLNDMKTENYT